MKVDLLFSNTLGHCAGIAFFSLLFYLFFIDWKRSERFRSGLSAIAAGLGLIWNVGDLLALAPGFPQDAFHIRHTVTFSALTFFSAVLLHIWARKYSTSLWIGGYLVRLSARVLQTSAELTAFLPSLRIPSLTSL